MAFWRAMSSRLLDAAAFSLAGRLVTATQADRLVWTRDSPDEYHATWPESGSVHLRFETRANGEPVVRMTIGIPGRGGHEVSATVLSYFTGPGTFGDGPRGPITRPEVVGAEEDTLVRLFHAAEDQGLRLAERAAEAAATEAPVDRGLLEAIEGFEL
jgi:hypothetical protein